MTLTINDSSITSDRTACTARYVPDRSGWEVSSLPGHTLDRNTAITAMTLAEAAAEPDLREGHQLWAFVQGWAEELGLTAPEAIARATQPASDINQQQEPASRQYDHEAVD